MKNCIIASAKYLTMNQSPHPVERKEKNGQIYFRNKKPNLCFLSANKNAASKFRTETVFKIDRSFEPLKQPHLPVITKGWSQLSEK